MKEGIEVDKYREYEKFKQYLWSLKLSHKEYEKRLREWCGKNDL